MAAKSIAYSLTLFASIHSQTIVSNEWNDDFLCNINEWSNCDIIYQTSNHTIINTMPLFHGPYAANNDDEAILSRPFKCLEDSKLTVSYTVAINCLFDLNTMLTLHLNDMEYHTPFNNDSMFEETNMNHSALPTCQGIWDKAHIIINDIFITNKPFDFIFTINTENTNITGEMIIYDIKMQCEAVPWFTFFGLSYSATASLFYFSLYVLLLLFLAVIVLKKSEDIGCKGFFHKIYKMRSIYGSVLVHLYDTATDIGVMIDWWILAQHEKNSNFNYESIDMANMFWVSISFLACYRIVNFIMVAVSERPSESGYGEYLFNLLLATLDMYILKTVWRAAEDDKEEPTPKQRLIQLAESICESLPQVLLQTVFIIKGYNDARLRENSNILLIVASLSASVISITNKFIWLDSKDINQEEYKSAEVKCKFPCIRWEWTLRVLWRFAAVSVRIIVFALVWVVLGGAFLPIYAGFLFVYWGIYYGITEFVGMGSSFKFKDNIPFWLMITVITIASNPIQGDKMKWLWIPRTFDNCISLIVITIFATNGNIVCSICADAEERQIGENKYILPFIVVGWGLVVFEVISFIKMVVVDEPWITDTDAEDAFNQIREALEDKKIVNMRV